MLGKQGSVPNIVPIANKMENNGCSQGMELQARCYRGVLQENIGQFFGFGSLLCSLKHM
jgi:hypothetical protein